MPNHSDSHKSDSKRKPQTVSNLTKGGSTQMSGNQKSGGGGSTSGKQSSSSSRKDIPDYEQGDGEMGPMHTNAGSTGTGSGQISPKTQNMPQTGPSASHPARKEHPSD